MRKFLSLFLCFITCTSVMAQDPLRFKDEVDKLTAADSTFERKNKLILFTGSSSIRLWKNLEASFADHEILNRGFGGSEMSDLVYYADRLIIPYSPRQIIIYEGDNDLGHNEKPGQIMKEANQLLKIIRDKYPDTPVLFLTPKPSPSRWHLKKHYEKFVRKLKRWSMHQHDVKVIDVWHPLIQNGQPLRGIFLEDNLHMNEQGYARWKEIIAPYLIQ